MAKIVPADGVPNPLHLKNSPFIAITLKLHLNICWKF